MIKNNLCKDVIKKISYRRNIILLEFNENMDVEGEHSYLIPKNYAIKKVCTMGLLPKGTKIEVIKKGYIIKIILPLGLNYLNEKCYLNLGYIFKNNLFYIESKERIIDSPYNIKNIGKEVEELNLKNGICEIIGSHSLRYLYKGKNKFQYINIGDFYIEKDNRIYYPESFEINSNRQIIFKFKEDIFATSNEYIYLNVNHFTKSKDIYGFFIPANAFIKVNNERIVYIESLSFSNYENNLAFLKIKFSKPLLKFRAKDYCIEYNNKKYDIEFSSIDSKKMTIDVSINNAIVEDFIGSSFKLCMAVEYEEIKTIDYLGEKVFIEREISSKYFSSINVSWDLKGHTIKNSLISIGFNEQIVSSSIITNSNFDLEEIAWKNKILIIPPEKIILSYKGEKEIILSLSNNKEFGNIVISFKNKIQDKKKTKFNSNSAILYLKDNNLFIKFHEEEILDFNFLDTENIKYYPGSNIKNIENYFIFYGYHPIGKFNIFQPIINLKPLENEEENPFKGGTMDASYIVNVDNKNKFRTYGIYENQTIIEGFLKIIGNLTINEIIFIKNLKVLGKVYVNIGDGSIELDGLQCNDLVYN